jgi:hypothetical protein
MLIYKVADPEDHISGSGNIWFESTLPLPLGPNSLIQKSKKRKKRSCNVVLV